MGASRTITIDAATKLVTVSPATIALYERVAVTVVNASDADSFDLELSVIFRTETVARCQSFSASGVNHVGTLDLGSAGLVAMFTGLGPRDTLQFDLSLYDSGRNKLLVNDRISIMNNPYTPGMALGA